MIGRFFYTPKSKQFNIRPRFYDPDKEDREERERRIKEELGIPAEKKDDRKNYRPRVKGQFRNHDGWQAKSSDEARKAQNKRLIYLFIILALIFYLFFYSDFLF
ncbi:MAG: hypothetical protein FD181_2074 [Prolixibacteraceae bacterium]|nr:MAG: hypothetical protein FD181_2074 [Prolixibacteraceae bacterium]